MPGLLFISVLTSVLSLTMKSHGMQLHPQGRSTDSLGFITKYGHCTFYIETGIPYAGLFSGSIQRDTIFTSRVCMDYSTPVALTISSIAADPTGPHAYLVRVMIAYEGELPEEKMQRIMTGGGSRVYRVVTQMDTDPGRLKIISVAPMPVYIKM